MKKYKNRFVVELTTTQLVTCKEAGRIARSFFPTGRINLDESRDLTLAKVTVNEFNRVMASEMLKHPVFHSMTKGVPTKAKRS